MDKHILPIVTMKGVIVFPGNLITFDVGREQSVNAIEQSIKFDTEIFLVSQRDYETENPEIDDIYKVGTVCKVTQIIRFADDKIRVLAHGRYRAKLFDVTHTLPFMEGVIAQIPEKENVESKETEALTRNLINIYSEYSELNSRNAIDIKNILAKVGKNLETLTYEIANDIDVSYELKQEILEGESIQLRAEKLMGILVNEVDILKIQKDISIKVQKQITKVQKNSYLREQIKAIKTELGENDSLVEEVERYKKQASEMNLPEEVHEKVMKEINRLSIMMSSSPEVPTLTNYLNLVLSLPWDKKSEESSDIKKAEEILNEDHYGLDDIKERILEYLAVRNMDNSLRGPILCLVGPPGVGKTSIARSIARALNRNYVKISLGGVKDESEIRGHRKTYIGAMCGRIISAINQAGSNNPLMLLDEIDKMSNDYRGDPASAMLEVLDPEQNSSFRDNYLELPFDLSDVLFIATANNPERIPRPLFDRMEIIDISSYTDVEKYNIASKFLFPKQLKVHGLNASKVKINKEAMEDIITFYTAEAGVRKLELQLAKLCRKIAKEFALGKRKSFTVTQKNLESLLGPKKRLPNKIMDKDEIGIATGLAWTSIGGVTLSIEVNVMPGSGKLELTGQLGDVMKESAMAAISYIRSKSDEYGIAPDFNTTNDIHIHVPEGATPKDGPSAGITLATALVSALTKTPCRMNVAMTGEITIRGRVLPIGGLKEKSLAAYRAGIKEIIIPEDNVKDLSDIPDDVKANIKFTPVSKMDSVLKTALVGFSPIKRQNVGQAIVIDDGKKDFITDIM